MSADFEALNAFKQNLDGNNVNKLSYKKNQGNETIIDEDKYNNGIDYGLYLTPAFYRGYPEQPFGVSFDQSFTADATTNDFAKNNKNNKLNFDIETVKKQRPAELFSDKSKYPKLKDEYLFEFFFPVNYVEKTIMIYRMSIKKLPFEMKYVYSKDSSNIPYTTPHINNLTIEEFTNRLNSQSIESIASVFKDFLTETFLDGAYDLYQHAVAVSADNTYSSFILEINNNNNFQTNKNLLIKRDQQKKYKHIIFENYKNQIKSDKYRISNNINNTGKKIHYNKIQKQFSNQELKDRNEWPLIYSKSIIYPELNTLEKRYPGFENKLANYYDISFDCDTLPVFMYSHFSPGFNVINSKPSGIYGEKDVKTDTSTNPEEKSVFINFDDVYKEIFYSKIIELIPS